MESWKKSYIRPGTEGTFYRAGYEEKTPGDFHVDGPEDYLRFDTCRKGLCFQCNLAFAQWETWRASQEPSKASEPLNRLQAHRVLADLIASLPAASTRGFSFEGEHRDPAFLKKALEILAEAPR